ncbi:alanine dehydrogenase [Amphibacillus sp. MSJ-3]|uniref:alanine dehydrogenase n=1 Tax=Amphibacillus sp. MSJ-3 TaxID=2841505 RepID=UPI001C0EF1A0|nr:alanine dehydrogenase [Amphibacillus sp. MSJ-3]MBU5593777.1 alanine dehydrogenase [Amphibacillus sp. MSJ-3]
MKIGIPKEIKSNESRVAITAMGVKLLKQKGHDVYIETGAGVGADITDEEYQEAGATILEKAEDVWSVDMVMKVKEPQQSEYKYFRKGLIIFTYFHLANEPELAKALVESGATAVAYETMVGPKDDLPMLMPMSVIAGRISVQIASYFLQSPQQGKGKLIGGVPGVKNGKVVIIGGGIAGQNALQIARGLGAHVTILDVKPDVLQQIEEVHGSDVITLMSNEVNIAESIRHADIVVGAVLIPGSKAPKLVTEEMVKSMEPGSVIVDIAVDQGGIFETEDRTTTHDDPIYIKHGVLHYAVPNMPGAVPKTSTIALTNVTVPHALDIAERGVVAAAEHSNMIYTGVNVYDGYITNKSVAEALDMEYRDFAKLV